ncbi:MAG TPA: hypothetical protein VNI52_04320 [Sphingobacteriaceae bacterium]|nr:hypothetical protein [Sphingobacteriaceae bacterium]
MKLNFLLLLALFFLISCNSSIKSQSPITPPNEQFNKKWNAGKAELTSYDLQQARYGEIRNGEAVLIFVTEDFSKDKLVKLDEPDKANDKIRVMKMNMTKEFVTGIYPYSMMLSVFTPVSKNGKEKTVKANCSSQEWCGHTFSQLSLKGSSYNWQLHSYFEKEGEEDKKIDYAILEDELWNQIRINPANLPQGKMNLIPGLLWQRLSHSGMKKEEAVLSLTKADTVFIKEVSAQLYTIFYPTAQRTLQIYFQTDFPHEILGWQETYPDGFGANKKMLTTKAIRKKTIWLDYWNHNSNADSTYLDSLQLK